MARIHQPTVRNLAHLARVLRRGGLVAIPTETVYGLAANALDARACGKIFRAKGRPARDPLIVHVADLQQAEGLAYFNDTARRLARYFWPGPLTLILPKGAMVPGVVTAGRPSVGLRSPAHPVARRLIRQAGVPLAAPSANPFGYISPTTAAHVQENLGRRVAHVLDGGPCRHGIESTVVDVSNPARCVILRAGAVTAGQLRAALRGRKVAVVAGRQRGGQSREGLRAPGLLSRHYSPRTPLGLARSLDASVDLPADTGRIFFRKPAGTKLRENEWSLSTRGSLAEAARRLYAVLREADARGLRALVAERAPAGTEGTLAEAINDRLRRAAARG